MAGDKGQIVAESGDRPRETLKNKAFAGPVPDCSILVVNNISLMIQSVRSLPIRCQLSLRLHDQEISSCHLELYGRLSAKKH